MLISTLANFLEPPSFVGKDKIFSVYEKDLLRWARLTTLKPELQAEMVVHRLEREHKATTLNLDGGSS